MGLGEMDGRPPFPVLLFMWSHAQCPPLPQAMHLVHNFKPESRPETSYDGHHDLDKIYWVYLDDLVYQGDDSDVLIYSLF